MFQHANVQCQWYLTLLAVISDAESRSAIRWLKLHSRLLFLAVSANWADDWSWVEVSLKFDPTVSSISPPFLMTPHCWKMMNSFMKDPWPNLTHSFEQSVYCTQKKPPTLIIALAPTTKHCTHYTLKYLMYEFCTLIFFFTLLMLCNQRPLVS